jgi:DNA-binding IclR family transcriptional regulator
MLTRGLSLLVAIAEHPDGIGVTELARNVGLPASTTHRLLSTMAGLGFVTLEPTTRRYGVGPKVFEVAHRAGAGRTLADVALPVMRKVSAVTEETVFASRLDDGVSMLIQRVDGPKRVRIRGEIGERGPLHCTALGKCLLAFQDDADMKRLINQAKLSRVTPKTTVDRRALRQEMATIRDAGFSVCDREYEEHISAVAVPICDQRSTLVGAMSICTPAFDGAMTRLLSHVPLLQESAREIALQLGD